MWFSYRSNPREITSWKLHLMTFDRFILVFLLMLEGGRYLLRSIEWFACSHKSDEEF